MKANAAQGAEGLTVLRQGTDGTQAEEILPCGPKLHKSRRMEGAGPCPDTLLILEVKGNSPITHLQKSSLEVKTGGRDVHTHGEGA